MPCKRLKRRGRGGEDAVEGDGGGRREASGLAGSLSGLSSIKIGSSALGLDGLGMAAWEEEWSDA